VPSTSGSTGPSSALTPPSSAGSSIPSSNKTLVALGDSITFGYRLPGATATSPSPDAYPYLIGKKLHYQVTDLGVTGWTSSDLLNALQTNHRYQIALRKANLVTLDIGSNDLLHTSYDLIAALQQNLPPKDDVLTDSRYQAALTQYSANMAQILTVIHQQTKAPIVLLNLYDPFPDGSSIHDIGEQLIAAANQVIWQMAAQSAVPVVNVYDTINHHQDTLVRLDSLDIHPTIAGQQALAADVLQVLQHPLQAQPVYYAVAKAGLLIRSKPQLGPNAMHWLEAGTGVLVTERQADWLQVVTPSGQSGFVQQNLVNVVLRPWNDVSFTNYSTSLQTGVIRDEPSGKSADAFVWNGVVYAPVQYLASLASATVSVNSDTLQVDVETPAHSGLIQTGWLSPPPSSSSPPPSPKVSVQLEPSGPYGFIQFGTKGFMVSVDGEDVNLHGQVVEHQGQIAVPVQGFWQALGGTVTLDANGLPRLSVAGS
jgi:lysophospholipase L1-like esterase